MRKRVHARKREILLVFFLALFIGGMSACAPFTTHSQACMCGPGPQFFEIQPTQLFVTGAAGAFAVEMTDITPEQFRFYYVFHAAQPTSLRVMASAEAATDPSAPIQLATTDQTLGQIGAYTVGVVHVTRGQNVAQTITLEITPSTASGTSIGVIWHLAPLKQLIPTQQHTWVSGGATTNPNALPDAQWSPQVMSQQVSYVKIIMPGELAASRAYVFLRSDDPVTVTVITKAEYLAIAGSANFTP